MSAAPPFAEPWRNRPDTFVAAIATAVRNASTQISARVSVALSRHELLEFDLAAGGVTKWCCAVAMHCSVYFAYASCALPRSTARILG
jgi:hypothetical protein